MSSNHSPTAPWQVVLRPETAEPVGVNLNTAAAAEAALRTFWRLAEAWKLNTAEQIALLGVARTTLYQWKQGRVGPLDRHVLERLSYLFGIYGALQILLPCRSEPTSGSASPTRRRSSPAVRRCVDGRAGG